MVSCHFLRPCTRKCSSSRVAVQALLFGEQPVTAPHPAHAAGGDLHARGHQLLRDPQGIVAGMIQTVDKGRLLDLGEGSVRNRPAGKAGPS